MPRREKVLHSKKGGSLGAGHINREYAIGPDWQPFESQPNIAQRVNVAPMSGLPGVAHGNSFGSTIAQFNEGLGRPGVEHDVDWPAVEVPDQLQVPNLGPRHHEAAEPVT